MSKRDLSMVVSHGEWEDLQAEVERLRELVELAYCEGKGDINESFGDWEVSNSSKYLRKARNNGPSQEA